MDVPPELKLFWVHFQEAFDSIDQNVTMSSVYNDGDYDDDVDTVHDRT